MPTDNPERSIIPHPDAQIERVAGGGNRILAAMIDETLSLVQQESQPLPARFKIGTYEWCEPDYRQILSWAEALALDPETVIERLLDAPSKIDRVGGVPDWVGTHFGNGRIIGLHWDLGKLPLAQFQWLSGLDISALSFFASTTHGVRVQTLDLPLPNLRRLHCASQNLCILDLSQVQKLECLACFQNDIERLDLSCLPLLKELECFENPISELDVIHTPLLTELDCGDTKVSELHLSCIPRLKFLRCGDTRISELHLSAVPSLVELWCMNNTEIRELDLVSVPELQVLDCRSTSVSEWDLEFAATPRMTLLWCSGSNIRELDLELLPNLESLDCDADLELDLSLASKLRYLNWNCRGSDSEMPDLAAIPDLRELWISGHGGQDTTRIDLSVVPKLDSLHLQHNVKIDKLDLSCVPNLAHLSCHGIKLTELDITPLKHLKSLFYNPKWTRLVQRPDQHFGR